MRLLILRLLGWKRFTYKSINIFQRAALIDQTIISQALDDTEKVRTWCPAKSLTIIIEDQDFSADFRAGGLHVSRRPSDSSIRLLIIQGL